MQYQSLMETVVVSPISHDDLVIVTASDLGDPSLGIDRASATVARLVTIAVGDRVQICMKAPVQLVGKKITLDVQGEVVHERSEKCKKIREHTPHLTHHERTTNAAIGMDVRVIAVLAAPSGSAATGVKEREVKQALPLDWTVPHSAALSIRFEINRESVVFQPRGLQFPDEQAFLNDSLSQLRSNPKYTTKSHVGSVQAGNVGSIQVEITVTRNR